MSLTARKPATWFALAVTALLILPISHPGADTTGRDFARCIRACNAARQSCADQCASDCRSLYSGNIQQLSACASACKESCVDAEQQCKAVCRAIKEGTSPNEP